MTQTAQHPLLAALGRDPAIYPHQLDLVGDRVLLTNIPLTVQSEAVFLDQRVLTPQTAGGWAAWTQFATAAQTVSQGRLAYIMHAGHCGSTLLSRLVQAVTGARALREPLPLRSLAEEAADAHSGASLLTDKARKERLALLERVWAGAGGAVVKSTSICNGLVDEVRSDAPVAFVYVKPEIFLALLLGGANTHIDLRSFAKMRMRRLLAKTELPASLSAMSPGELAAMSWLAETTAIADSARAVHVIDFDQFLSDPAPALEQLCRHLGWPAEAGAIEAAVSGPIMQRYAKAPEHAYDAATRARIIAEDRAQYREEIDRGMRWLQRVAANWAPAQAALSRFSAS